MRKNKFRIDFLDGTVTHGSKKVALFNNKGNNVAFLKCADSKDIFDVSLNRKVLDAIDEKSLYNTSINMAKRFILTAVNIDFSKIKTKPTIFVAQILELIKRLNRKENIENLNFVKIRFINYDENFTEILYKRINNAEEDSIGNLKKGYMKGYIKIGKVCKEFSVSIGEDSQRTSDELNQTFAKIYKQTFSESRSVTNNE